MKRALILAFLAACAEPTPAGRSMEGLLLIQSHTLIPMEPVFGYITRVKFVVENPKDGADAFLVVSIEPTRNTAEETFVFRHGDHSEGLLLPGQSLVLERSFRVMHPTETFRFHVVRLSIPGVMQEWGWNEAQLETYRKFHGRIVEPRARPVPESVTVSDALSKRPTEAQAIEVGFGKLPDPRVSFETASQKAGKHESVTYSLVLGGWIFKSGSKDILVSANYPRTEVASCPPRAYRDMDVNNSIDVKLDFASAKALGFEGKPTGETSRSFRIEVPALRFKEFLKKAGEQGKTIRIGPTGYTLE
jgi:hypothetical protein